MAALSFAPLTARAAASVQGVALNKPTSTVARAANVNTGVRAELKATKGVPMGEVMAFSGVAPELINGRLAMLGFAACAGAEVATGETFSQQLAASPVPVIAGAAVFILAGFMPKFRGEEMNPAFGWAHLKGSKFSDIASIEMLNGRTAMIGLAILIIQEQLNGTTVF